MICVDCDIKVIDNEYTYIWTDQGTIDPKLCVCKQCSQKGEIYETINTSTC
jgi:hypothetical protein